MKKIKAFVSQHQLVTLIGALILLFAIAKGASWYSQYQAQKKFEREHPLVNKVYKYHYVEKPADGGTSSGNDYYVFGDEEHRGKVAEFTHYNGGLKEAKKTLNSKAKYEKAFKGAFVDNYRVVDGNKLVIGNDTTELNNYQVKRGKNWVGMYDSDGHSEEVSGEVHKLTPVHIK